MSVDTRERILMAAKVYLEKHDIETLTLRHLAELPRRSAAVARAVQHICELPAEIDCVLDARVHALPAGR